MQYYKILNIEPRYDIDLKELHKQYLLTQAKYHPDKAENEQEKQCNLNISIELNKAYKTLNDDLARSIYILEYNQISMDDKSLKHVLAISELQAIYDDMELIDTVNETDILVNMLNTKLDDKKKLVLAIAENFNMQLLKKALYFTLKLKYLNNSIEHLKQKIKQCN